MWISFFAVTLAIAVGSCVAAIMMQPERMRARWAHAPMRQVPPEPAGQATPLPAQEYAEGADGPRPLSSSLPECLRQHYGHVLIEPIPAHLAALVRHIENLAPRNSITAR
jgi:hypothetical protein